MSNGTKKLFLPSATRQWSLEGGGWRNQAPSPLFIYLELDLCLLRLWAMPPSLSRLFWIFQMRSLFCFIGKLFNVAVPPWPSTRTFSDSLCLVWCRAIVCSFFCFCKFIKDKKQIRSRIGGNKVCSDQSISRIKKQTGDRAGVSCPRFELFYLKV